MADCMFKGRIETCINCNYYFACKARGDVSREQEEKFFKDRIHNARS